MKRITKRIGNLIFGWSPGRVSFECGFCRLPLVRLVSIRVKLPVGHLVIRKSDFRKPSVTIEAADWENSRTYYPKCQRTFEMLLPKTKKKKAFVRIGARG